jgi:hypothetical protein
MRGRTTRRDISRSEQQQLTNLLALLLQRHLTFAERVSGQLARYNPLFPLFDVSE